MLAAITTTTLLDDVLHEDQTTNALEEFIAELLPTRAPKPAHAEGDHRADAAATAASQHEGLLVMSGTMGNQVALRAHLGSPPHSVLGDHRAHIFAAEAGALCMTAQAYPISVVPRNGRHLTLADVKAAAVLDDNVHHCPTRVISLENTLHGSILPLADVAEISDWAHTRGIIVHMDGARLWDAVVACCARGDFPDLRAGLRAYASLVDSVTVCFSKGLGAPIGSLLVGSPAFIKRARHIRKMLGGGTRMAGLLAAPARVAVDDTFFGGKMARAHQLARTLAAAWMAHGGVLVAASDPPDTGMLWLDLPASGVDPARLGEAAKQRGLQGYWDNEVVRIVCHYQIADEAVEKLVDAFRVVLEGRDTNGSDGAATLGQGFNYGTKKVA